MKSCFFLEYHYSLYSAKQKLHNFCAVESMNAAKLLKQPIHLSNSRDNFVIENCNFFTAIKLRIWHIDFLINPVGYWKTV